MRHFDWYALRLFVLHQTAQVVPRQVQEVGLHTQEVRIDEVAEKKAVQPEAEILLRRRKSNEKETFLIFRFEFHFLLLRVPQVCSELVILEENSVL